jgi:hypothetical protein
MAKTTAYVQDPGASLEMRRDQTDQDLLAAHVDGLVKRSQQAPDHPILHGKIAPVKVVVNCSLKSPSLVHFTRRTNRGAFPGRNGTDISM